MVDEDTVLFGVPKGTLNEAKKWNTSSLLAAAGFDIDGYEPGKERDLPALKREDGVELVLIRPTESVVLLYKGGLDLLVTGLDMWNERTRYRKSTIDRYYFDKRLQLKLGFGEVDIAAIVTEKVYEQLFRKDFAGVFEWYEGMRESGDKRTPLRVYTKYLQLAREWIDEITARYYPAQEHTAKIDVPGLGIINEPSSGDSEDALKAPVETEIIKVDGLTETLLRLGLADVIIEAVQSGNSLLEHHLRALERVFISEACLIADGGVIPDDKNEGMNIYCHPINRKKAQKVEEIVNKISEVLADIRMHEQVCLRISQERWEAYRPVLEEVNSRHQNGIMVRPAIYEGKAVVDVYLILNRPSVQYFISNLRKLTQNPSADLEVYIFGLKDLFKRSSRLEHHESDLVYSKGKYPLMDPTILIHKREIKAFE